MGTVTVAELQSSALPPETKLLAGTDGLRREVSWTATLRTRPPAFQSLKGGEFLLISTESLRLLDSTLSLARLIQSISRFGVAAAAVVGEIPADAISQAESAGIPLFALPFGATLTEVDHSLNRAIVEWQNELQRQSQEIYRHLTELALEGQGVPAIAAVLARATGRPVAHEDRAFTLTFHGDQTAGPAAGGVAGDEIAAAFRAGQAEVQEWLRSRRLSPSEPPSAEFRLASTGLARLVAPIVLREGVVGCLSLIGEADSFREIERLSIVRAAAACAIEGVRESAALDAEERAGVTFLDELLTGAPVSADAIRRLASRLGLDLSQPQIVLVLRQHIPQRRGIGGSSMSGASAAATPATAAALSTAVEREFGRRQVKALCRGWEGTAAVVFAAPSGSEARTEVQALIGGIAARLGTPVSVGVSQPRAGATGVPEAFREAQGALNLGSRLFGPGRTTFYGDLGLYRLLLALSESPELRAFHEDALGQLITVERKTNGELLRTLEAYFASRCSPTEAAERLHVHRNTLLYRLRRIEAITGLDLEDPETRLALNLALHIGQVLDGS